MSDARDPNDQELMNVDPSFPAGPASSSEFGGPSSGGSASSGGLGRTAPKGPSFSAPLSGEALSSGGLPVGGLDDLMDTAEVDLGDDPFDDDLSNQLQARTPLKLTSRPTLALSGIVLVVAGFLGGVMVQKHFGTTSTASSTRGGTSFPGGGAGGGAGANGTGGTGAGGTGGAGTGAAGRNATTGTVKFVDGTTIYLTTADGSTITVKTSGTTAVRVVQTGAAKDIPVGSTVVVQGTADADGIITATQVTAQK
jgi:hypothetical protein